MKKNKKLTLILTLTTGILVGTAATVFAQNPIRLLVNGSEIGSKEAPVIVNGKVMVPIRTTAEALDKEVQWNAQKSEVNIVDREDLLTEYVKGTQKVKIWGEKSDGGYWGMRITLGEITRNFPFWYNVGNPSYAPQVYLQDLNQDGKDELLIILTTGYGTGFKEEKAYIFDSGDFSEIPLEDWQTYTLKHVVPGKVTKEGASIQIDHKELAIPHGIPEEDFKSGKPYWYESPAYGQYFRYEVRNDKLYAIIPLWFSPALSSGQLEIEYSYKDKFFQGNGIKYVESE